MSSACLCCRGLTQSSHQQFPFGTAESLFLHKQYDFTWPSVELNASSADRSVCWFLVCTRQSGNSLSHPDSTCSISWVTEKQDSKYASCYVMEPQESPLAKHWFSKERDEQTELPYDDRVLYWRFVGGALGGRRRCSI